MQGTWALTIRSLRQDSRVMRYHLMRLAIASALTFFVFGMWTDGLRSESPGREVLEFLAYVNLFAVTVVGCLLFAPTITEEKEEQTLGLLRMTRIGPSALLLGKALPKLALIVLVLIVQLPLVFLTRTLGGVDWSLITNVYLLIFCQLLGVVALSMLASVVMRTSFGAVVLAAALAFSWSVLLPGIREEIIWRASQGAPVSQALLPAAELLVPFSPYDQLVAVLMSGANVAGTFTTCLAVLLLLGMTYLFSVWSFAYWNSEETTQTELEWLNEKMRRGWYRVTHFWTRRASVPSPVLRDLSPSTDALAADALVVQTFPAKSAPGVSVSPDESACVGRTRRSRSSWKDAIAWKDFFLVGGGRIGLWSRCLLAFFGSLANAAVAGSNRYGMLEYERSDTWIEQWIRDSANGMAWGAICAFCLDLLYITVNLFAYEQRRQTWESLILLPVSLGSICRQKIWGAAIHLLPWIVTFLCGLAMVVSIEDVQSVVSELIKEPLLTISAGLQIVTQFVTLLLVLTALSLRLNPWVSIVITWFLYWGIGFAYIITFFITFGFMSAGLEYPYQVVFHCGWIGGVSLAGYLLLRSIRSKLQGEASRI